MTQERRNTVIACHGGRRPVRGGAQAAGWQETGHQLAGAAGRLEQWLQARPANSVRQGRQPLLAGEQKGCWLHWAASTKPGTWIQGVGRRQAAHAGRDGLAATRGKAAAGADGPDLFALSVTTGALPPPHSTAYRRHRPLEQAEPEHSMSDNLGSSEPLLEDLEGQAVWHNPPQLEASCRAGGGRSARRRRPPRNQRLAGCCPRLFKGSSKLKTHERSTLHPRRMLKGR